MPCGGRDRDGMGVADRELEVLALHLRAISDALNLQALLIAGRDALNHVGHKRACEAVQRTMLAAIGRARDDQALAVLDDLDVAWHALRELALGALHAHRLWLYRHGHAGWHCDWLSTDSRHDKCLPDLREDLAADAGGARVVTCHHAARGGHDRSSHPAEHLGDARGLHVGAPARVATRVAARRSPSDGRRCTSSGSRSARPAAPSGAGTTDHESM